MISAPTSPAACPPTETARAKPHGGDRFASEGKDFRVIRLLTTVAAALALATGLLQAPSAGASATTPVQIDIAGAPVGGNPRGGGGRFSTQGRTAGDAGTATYSFAFPGSGTSPSGQPYARFKGTLYLTGRRGSLVLATKGLSFGASGDGADAGRDVWTGTWHIVGGTGSYAGMKGNGALVGIAGPSAKVALRLNGHVG
jgi:hypothetical protein